MKVPEPKKIKIIQVDNEKLYELQIFKRVIHSRAGALLVKLKPQKFEGVEIPKTEIWFPPCAYLSKESTQPEVVVSGKYINPFLRSLQIRKL